MTSIERWHKKHYFQIRSQKKGLIQSVMLESMSRVNIEEKESACLAEH